jgi:hypothetical protein
LVLHLTEKPGFLTSRHAYGTRQTQLNTTFHISPHPIKSSSILKHRPNLQSQSINNISIMSGTLDLLSYSLFAFIVLTMASHDATRLTRWLRYHYRVFCCVLFTMAGYDVLRWRNSVNIFRISSILSRSSSSLSNYVHLSPKLHFLLSSMVLNHNRKRKRRPWRKEIHNCICQSWFAIPCRSYWPLPPSRKVCYSHGSWCPCLPCCCLGVLVC